MGQITRTNYGLTANLDITDAEMLALHDTPLEIVAGRAGTIWLPLMIAVVSDTTAGAYATVADFQLGVTGALTEWGSISLADSQLDSGANSFAVSGTNLMGGIVVGGPKSDVVGLPILISANANPTGGDPSNRVSVRLFYMEIPALSTIVP